MLNTNNLTFILGDFLAGIIIVHGTDSESSNLSEDDNSESKNSDDVHNKEVLALDVGLQEPEKMHLAGRDYVSPGL